MVIAGSRVAIVRVGAVAIHASLVTVVTFPHGDGALCLALLASDLGPNSPDFVR